MGKRSASDGFQVCLKERTALDRDPSSLGTHSGKRPTAPGRHVEDVRSACAVEHIGPIEETRERLAIPAVADEAEAAGWGDVACDAAHAAAPAPKRKVQGHA